MRLTLTILAAAFSASAYATEIQDKDNEFGFLGLSSIYRTTVFSVEDSPSLGITPNLFYAAKWGFIDASLGTYNVLPYLGLSANWRFAEVSNSVDDLADGIEDRDGNPELGITIGTPGARITYLHDVANVHQGQEIRGYLARSFNTPINGYKITPFIEVDWRDKKLSQHLYGINASEATASGLNQYNADATWVYKAGAVGLYEITGNWLMFNKVRFETHDSDSDLVQRDVGWLAEIGLVYQFAGN